VSPRQLSFQQIRPLIEKIETGAGGMTLEWGRRIFENAAMPEGVACKQMPLSFGTMLLITFAVRKLRQTP